MYGKVSRRRAVRSTRQQAVPKIFVVSALAWALLTCNLSFARGVRAEAAPPGKVPRAAADAPKSAGKEAASAASAETRNAPAAAVASAVQVPADAALLVVGSASLNDGDSAIKTRFEALGYAVTVKTAVGVTTADAAGKTVVFVSETCFDGDVNTKFRDVSAPVIVSESALFHDMMMTGPAAAVDWANTMSQTQLVVADESHPLAAGLKGTVTAASSPVHFGWGKPGAGAERVARLRNQETQFGVFGYERGAAMVSATAPSRRVGYYLAGATAATLNGTGWELFDDAVRWATYGEAVPASPVLRPNGRVVFTSSRDGNQEIYSMNADGTGQTRLTTNSAADTDPSYSPDGTKIVFTSTRDGNEEIYVMNADGTGQRRLTEHTANDNDPAWSPDGAQIAASKGRRAC